MVAAPPSNLSRTSGTGAIQMMVPMMGSAGGLVMMMARPNPLLVLGGAITTAVGVLSGVGMGLQTRTANRRRADDARERYIGHLVDVRRALEVSARAQSTAASWRHPAPEALLSIAADHRRVWERRPGDPDFLEVRVGTGRVPMARKLRLEARRDPLSEEDRLCAIAGRRLAGRWGHLDDQPLTIRLDAGSTIVVRGPREIVVPVVRSMLAQAVAFHAPQDLHLGVVAEPSRLADWSWCKWLGHTADPSRHDGAGPSRLLDDSVDRFLVALQGSLIGAGSSSLGHLLVVIDGCSHELRLKELLSMGASRRVTSVHVIEREDEEPEEVGARVTVGAGDRLTIDAGSDPAYGLADRMSHVRCDSLARRLARRRLSDDPGDAAPGRLDVQRLLAIGDAATLDTSVSWQPRSQTDFLRVAFALGPRGEPVFLDLKESALGGHGPHGLLIGATGSGKSELLRTVIAGLVATHPPDLLAMVLIDFKGGAAFAGLSSLPHVAGTITNLAQDPGLIDRMKDALIGEQRRRQQLLAAAGGLANIRDYQMLRARDRPDLEPMPNLLVVIDEFSELLVAKPDLIDVFVAIGRLGRSLGVHLLLSSQRLEEGKLRGLDSHLSYRLGLRTFSAAESRTVLGVTDAYQLPPVPGAGYLKVDTTVWARFNAVTVSEPYRAPNKLEATAAPKAALFGTITATGESIATDAVDGGGGARSPSILDVLVDRLTGAAPAAHQIWVPPLPPAVTLDSLLGPIERTTERGLVATRWPGLGRLRVPLGLVDVPQLQRVDTLAHDLSGPAGHVAVVGAPQSGKTTFLRTLVTSLALTHAPTEVQVHALELGGGGLGALRGMPHVGTVAARNDEALVRRVVSEVHAQLEAREALFAAERIDTIVEYRRRRSAAELQEQRYGDLFLVIDGWAAFRQGFDDIEPLILEIAARGLGYGIHLALSAGRWLDLRAALKDAIGGRYELRLNDGLDSEIDRKVAKSIVNASAGRGLAAGALLCQHALPRIDGDSSASLTAATDRMVLAMDEAWPFQGAHEVRTLPDVVHRLDLADRADDGALRGVPIGLAESDLSVLRLDLEGKEPNLVVFGEAQSGKTSFLRAFAAMLAETAPPTEAQVLIVDYRRGLLDAVPASHLRGFAASGVALATEVDRLRHDLVARLPGADLTSAQLRSRSWWEGPELYVLVDDYDLVASPSSNPLQPLLELLPQGGDLGLHLILARRSSGLGRALFEPVMQRIRELGAQHLLLSGDPNEGAVAGPHRMAPRRAGRGQIVNRSGAVGTQLLWMAETDSG